MYEAWSGAGRRRSKGASHIAGGARVIAMAKSIGIGLAHGKALLLGEHSVVYGTPAIALPMASLSVRAKAHRGTHAVPGKSRAPLIPAIADVSVEVATKTVLRRQMPSGDIPRVEVDCSVPQGRGLGSSAARATAVARAVVDLYDARLDPDALYDLVQLSEQRTHGTASGVDARAVAADTPIWFEGGVARPLAVGQPTVFVVADTGVPGATDQAVAHVRAVLSTDPVHGGYVLARAGALVSAAADDLASGHLDALGQRMLAFQNLLGEMEVSRPVIDRLINAALEAGAYGAKLTGGGLGGCVLALAGSPDSAQRLRAALRRAGADSTWTISFGDRS